MNVLPSVLKRESRRGSEGGKKGEGKIIRHCLSRGRRERRSAGTGCTENSTEGHIGVFPRDIPDTHLHEAAGVGEDD